MKLSIGFGFVACVALAAAQVTDPAAATALWADIDRRLTWQAPWLFLYNNRQADFVSERVGNFQYNLQYGILLDQMWVK